MAMKMKTSAIVAVVFALVIGSVLVDLEGCENAPASLDLGGTGATSVDTGPTINGEFYGPSALKIFWDGDNTSHNDETLPWSKSTSPLGLTAAVTDAPRDPKVLWSISGPADAVVFDGYAEGDPVSPAVAVAIKPGTAFGNDTAPVTITAALEGYLTITESFTIIPAAAPAPIPVSSIRVSENTLELVIGNINNLPTALLTADVLPTNATDPTFTWSSGDPAIVTVDPATGGVKVTGLKRSVSADGKNATPVTITATANDGSGTTATCTVTVLAAYPVFDYTMLTSSQPLAPGDPKIIYNWGDPTLTLTWESYPAVQTDTDIQKKITESFSRVITFASSIDPQPYYDPPVGSTSKSEVFNGVTWDTSSGKIAINRYWPKGTTPTQSDWDDKTTLLAMRQTAFKGMVALIRTWIGEMQASPLSGMGSLKKMSETMGKWITYPADPIQDSNLINREWFDLSSSVSGRSQVVLPDGNTGWLFEYFFGYLGQ